jgi:hypothetical protein
VNARDHLRLAGYPEVLIFALELHDGRVSVHHGGPCDALLAAGLATPEMLASRSKENGSAILSEGLDPDGNEFHVMEEWAQRNGQKYRRTVIVRSPIPRTAALRLPGVREALAARRARLAPTGVPAVPISRGHLRLVVDNGRVLP